MVTSNAKQILRLWHKLEEERMKPTKCLITMIPLLLSFMLFSKVAHAQALSAKIWNYSNELDFQVFYDPLQDIVAGLFSVTT